MPVQSVLELGTSISPTWFTEVTIVLQSDRILKKEDSEVSERMLAYLRADGIEIRLNTGIDGVEKRNDEIVCNIRWNTEHYKRG